MKSKSILREIHDGEDVSDVIVKFFLWFGIIGALLIIVIALGVIRQQPDPDDRLKTYSSQLLQQKADPDWQRERERLRKKHGYPGAVIYEPGRHPYYRCGADRREKCKFI
jgi:hypothetical protein